MLAQMPEQGNPQDVPAFQPLQPCPYCGAPVRWMRHRMTGKLDAIDLAFTHFGLVLINITRGTYEELTPDEKRIHGAGCTRYIAIFAPRWISGIRGGKGK